MALLSDLVNLNLSDKTEKVIAEYIWLVNLFITIPICVALFLLMGLLCFQLLWALLVDLISVLDLPALISNGFLLFQLLFNAYTFLEFESVYIIYIYVYVCTYIVMCLLF